jgi:hypothetical protein
MKLPGSVRRNRPVENTEVGSEQAKFIGAEASKLSSSSLRNTKVYWEKRAITDSSGNVRIETKVFALVEMPEQDFKLAVMNAIRKSEGRKGIGADFAKKVDQHWEKFVNPDKDELRAPTASTADAN